MQSAGATVNIIGLPVPSSVVMVKTVSTWVRALCSHPRGGFSPINFVSFHVTLKALLPPGAKALPSSCASGTSFNCTKKKGRVYQKEKGRKKGADHHIKLRGLCLAQLERRGRCAATHSSAGFFSKQTPFLKRPLYRENVQIFTLRSLWEFSTSPFHVSCAQLSFLADPPNKCKVGTMPAQGEPGFWSGRWLLHYQHPPDSSKGT